MELREKIIYERGVFYNSIIVNLFPNTIPVSI